MRQARPGGFLSKDWTFFTALQFGIPVVLVTSGALLPMLIGARQGDLTLLWIALASALAGIALLFVAKWPLYHRGRYFTFGSKSVPEGRRPLYRIAYVFIVAGLLLMLLLWSAVR